MSEEQAQQQTPQASQETASSVIERVEAANRRAEENIAKQEAILKQQSELYAKQALAGRSMAGSTEAVKIEETPAQYKDRILRGG
jgi:hypothetical protein